MICAAHSCNPTPIFRWSKDESDGIRRPGNLYPVDGKAQRRDLYSLGPVVEQIGNEFGDARRDSIEMRE
jgi:hypothetical protein